MARLPYTIPYDPSFLGDGFAVPLPQTCCSGTLLNNGEVFDYIHFSLVMHRDRRMALYTAHNIDFSQKKSASRTGWDLDPRMGDHQVGNEAYRHNDYDRGHLVRRDAVVWGSSSEAKDASDSTFYYPVANLQSSAYNQGNSKWLGLEDWILRKAGPFANRLCVFTGPIYTEVDEEERGVKVPAAFFKVVVLRDPTADGQDLAALGFIMKQNTNWRSDGRRALTNLEPYHVSIAEIEAYTGLDFGAIADLDEFDWRQIRFRNRALVPPILIKGPDDIIFSGNNRRARGIRALRSFRSSTELQAAMPPSIARASAGPEQDCGCGCGGNHNHMDMKKEIKALKAQTTALCEIIETMLENKPAGGRGRAVVENGARSMLARIIGGLMVLPGEYPDCVAVGNQFRFFCTGVLVKPTVVLTAAHCVDDPITRVFLKGRQLSDPNSGEMRAVKEVIHHPDYDSNQVPWNDIAVLILEEPSTVEPIEIATLEEVAADEALVLVGFGSDSPDGRTGFGTKRIVNVGLTNSSGWTAAEIEEKQFELGYDIGSEFHGGDFRLGQDTCSGDSGGPAYIITGGKRKVAGLTSRAAANFQQNCGDGGIYTLIPAFMTWLEGVTGGAIVSPPVVDEPVGDDDDDQIVPPTTGGGLYISAALPNPSGPDTGNEWIEITNSSSGSIVLDGYKLADKQGGRLSLSGTIAAGKTQRNIIPANSPVKLGNNGDEILLHSPTAMLHKVSYSKAGSGQVIIFQSPFNETIPGGGTGGNTGTGGCGDGGSGGGGTTGGGGGGTGSGCTEPIDPNFTPGALRC